MDLGLDRPRFTLLDGLAAAFAVLLFFAFFLCGVPRNYSNSRMMQCKSNMRQVSLGLIGYLNAKNSLPNAGTFSDPYEIHGGDPTRSAITRSVLEPTAFAGKPAPWLHSWVVDILPYIDSQEVYDEFDRAKPYFDTTPNLGGPSSNAIVAQTDIGILRCPEDLTTAVGKGNLSYVVNGGFVRWHAYPVSWEGGPYTGTSKNGELLRWTSESQPGPGSLAICRKLGVMFLGAREDNHEWNVRTSPANISDGTATTLLLAENTLAGYSMGNRISGGVATSWACPLPNFTMFIGSDNVCSLGPSAVNCIGGQLAPTAENAMGTGWRLANFGGSFESMNYGQKLREEGSFPFANSAHRAGANFAFCDGTVRFLAATIDGRIYAKLITSAGEDLPSNIRQTSLSNEDRDELE
jgi:prepilin-type processing-associated H-X9-DG protein